jgi:hypothetical protein
MFRLNLTTRKITGPIATNRVRFVLAIAALLAGIAPVIAAFQAPAPPAGPTATAFPSPPQITNISCSAGVDNIWCFRGTVVGDNVWGLTVTFAGLPSVEGKTEIVQADGGFCLIVTLQQGEEGTVTGVTFDDYGQESNTAYWIVRQLP